jgi:hypothetical protein
MCSNQEILYLQSLKVIDQYHYSWDASLLFFLSSGVDVKDPMPNIFDHPCVEQDMFDIGVNIAFA